MRRTRKSIAKTVPALWREREGIAAIEFALTAPLLIWAVGLLIDFGSAFSVQLRIASAVHAAAQVAYTEGRNIDAATAPAYLEAVNEVAKNSVNLGTEPAISVLLNNNSNASGARSYFCISGSSPVKWTMMPSATSTCGNGVPAGRFVTISISVKSTYFFLPESVTSGISTLSDTAIVRLQ